MRIIHTTRLFEDAIAEAIGQNPELVQLADWPQLARRLQGKIEDAGLVLMHREKHPVLRGPMPPGRMVVAVARGNHQSVVASDARALAMLPPAVREKAMPDLWRDMFDQALEDLNREPEAS
jgi:hypothetical protein